MASRILSTATALPEHVLEGTQALALLQGFWPQLERIEDADLALGTRYTCEPVESLLRPRSLTALGAAYLTHARRLGLAAARNALGRAGLSGSDVDVIITVSCTGYLVPSLEVHLAGELGLRPDVIRVPITELGCSAGAAAIALAHRHLVAFPEQTVLVLAVELPSLSFQPRDRSPDNLTACLVFGDGAGAAVLRRADSGSAGLRIMATASHLVPGTADLLGFDLRDGGFHVVLDRRMPRIVRTQLRPVVEKFLDGAGCEFVAAHAGGPRIFDAIEAALRLPPTALQLSREVFESVGNTSSAAILFTLESLGRSLGSQPSEGIGLGLGPGISIELMHLAWAPSENARDESRPVLESLPVGARTLQQPLLLANAVVEDGGVDGREQERAAPRPGEHR